MQIRKIYNHTSIQLEQKDRLSTLGLKTLNGESFPFLIRPEHVLKNGLSRLLYPTGNLVPFQSFLLREPEAFDEVGVWVLQALNEAFFFVENSPFLERRYLLVEPEHIYIIPEAETAAFIIVPVEMDVTDESNQAWETLLCRLVKQITVTESVVYQEADKAEVGLREHKATTIEPLVEALKQSCNNRTLHMRNIGEIGEVELRYEGKFGTIAYFIRKDEFVIGKDMQADGVIEGNPSISRRHCVIRFEGGRWRVSDLDSTNHTYLNGMKLIPGKEMDLHSGMILRIADMGFQINIRS